MEALNKAGRTECACCGDRHVEFLVVDHKDSDGGPWRKMGTGSDFYRWLKRNNYPDMGRYRVLSHNCNFSIGAYGYCPHKYAELSRDEVGMPVADGGGERRSATQTTIH